MVPAWAEEALYGRVIGVAAGDSLTLMDAQRREYRLRLAGVDAPELRQPFGDEAQSALAAMVLNREVKARVLGPASDGDVPAEVIGPAGSNVNLELLSRGLGWFDYVERLPAAERERYQAASTEAQRERRGLWALDQLEAPRDYRSRIERAVRWWLYVVAFCAVLAGLAGIYAIYGVRIDAWLAKQDELERRRAEDARLAKIASEEETAERERTREVANREMDRLAAEKRVREQSARGAETENRTGLSG